MKLGIGNEHVTVSASRDLEVCVDEFSAGIGVFVEHGDWLTFLTQLSELEKTRRGEAILHSADGEDLSLRFYASGSAGHMAVAGHIERRDVRTYPRFSFEEVHFDPTLLPTLVAELAAVLDSSGSDIGTPPVGSSGNR